MQVGNKNTKEASLPKFDAEMHSDGCSLPIKRLLMLLPAIKRITTYCKPCCLRHDLLYYYGGAIPGTDIVYTRKQADDMMRECMEAHGEKFWAFVFYKAVRFGGSEYWPTKFRYGYGEDYAPRDPYEHEDW